MTIWTTQDNGKLRDEGVELAEMPWLRYWQGLEQHGTPKQKYVADSVRRMQLWNVLNWNPEPAEKVLKWIATGSFDLKAGAKA